MASEHFQQYSSLMRGGKTAEALRLAQDQERVAGQTHAKAFWCTQQAVALNRLRDRGRARECAERALQLEPVNVYAQLALAEAYVGEGQIDEGADLYGRIAVNPDRRAAARGTVGALECLARTRRWDRLLAALAGATIDPRDAFRLRVEALRGLGRAEEALAECRTWLAKFPDNSGALWAQTEIEIEAEGLDTVRNRLGRLARIGSRPPIYGQIYASLCRRAGITDVALGQYEKLHAQTGQTKLVRQKAFTLVDRQAHGGGLRLEDMPGRLRVFLDRHVGPLRTLCAAQGRRLIVTSDHGLSWDKGRLFHGAGGVYETAVPIFESA